MPQPHPSDRARAQLGRAPLPVEHVELWAWFYPTLGTGHLQGATWRDTGSDEVSYRIHHRLNLGPFDAELSIPQMCNWTAYRIARMTTWPQVTELFSDPFATGGDA